MSGRSRSDSRHGNIETVLLREQVNNQLGRLFDQLEDLEELRDELSDAEYTEEKEGTLDQLKEFQLFLQKATSGDMTLVDEFAATQLAIQAAVSDAFSTPDVIRMFATGESDQLRKKLASWKREFDLNHISKQMYNNYACEILVALKKVSLRWAVTSLLVLCVQFIYLSFYPSSSYTNCILHATPHTPPQMGESLSHQEVEFLNSQSNARHLEEAVNQMGENTKQSLITTVQGEVEAKGQ
jgi:hypothetical protein